jgi:hypothetical protein
MINIESIKVLINDKKLCKLWLAPESLSPKQVRDTLKDFAAVISFDLDSKTDENRLPGFIASLVEDILEMDSISEEEKDEEILKLIRDYPEDQKQLSSLAERAIKQINIWLKNCENEVYNKWLEGEYDPKALALFPNDIPCPVCEALSFNSQDFPGSYFICEECGWEDDNFQYYDPDYEGGVNDVSLNQARENYKLYKISDPKKASLKPNLS